MADEPIGSVSVNITGDYGELGKDFDAAVALAVEKGATLADAINQALAQIDASKVTTGIESIGQASKQAGDEVAVAAEQLNLFGEAADQIPFADANGQLNLFTTDLEDFTTGISAAAAMTEEMNQTAEDFTKGITQSAEAAEAAGEASKRGAEGSGELLKTLLEFTGIEITFEAIKEAITEMVEVFATVEKASISLTALSGSAEEAEATIERLKNQAMATATPFLELVQAQQKLTAAFVDNEAAYTQIPGVLHAASEAAAATGGSFATAANAIERIGLSGMVSGRMLVSLGLSADELAAKIGVATEDIAKAFKQMDPSERIQYIVEALGKFNGTAEAVASGVAGQMQQLKTQWEFVLEDMGKALAPVALDLIKFGRDAINEFRTLADGFNSLASAFKGSGTQIIETLTAIGVAVKVNPYVALGAELIRLGIAWRGLKDAEDAANESTDRTAQYTKKLEDQLSRQGVDIRELGRQFSGGKITAEEYLKGLQALSTEYNKQHGIVAGATDDHGKFTLKLKEEDDHFNMLVKDGLLLKATFEQIMSPLQNDAQYLARFNAALQEHTTILPKAGESMAEYRERIKSLGDNDLPVLTTGVADLTKELKAADAPMKALDLDLRGLDESGRQNIKDWTEFEAALRTLGLSGRKDLEHVENAAAKVFDAFQHGYATLNQAQQAYIREVNAEVAAGQHLSTQTQLQYAAIKFSIQAASAEAHLFENIMNTVSQDITEGLMAVVQHTETVGQAFQKLGLDILQIIIDTVIKQAISALITALVGIPVFAATSAIAQIQDAAAVAFANAYAANVGIPFVGPAVAAAAGAEAYTAVIGAESLLHFDNGGWVPEDMVAVVHKGEFVNPVGGPYAPIGSTTNNGGNVHIGSINLQGHPREMAKELAKLLKISSSAFTS